MPGSNNRQFHAVLGLSQAGTSVRLAGGERSPVVDGGAGGKCSNQTGGQDAVGGVGADCINSAAKQDFNGFGVVAHTGGEPELGGQRSADREIDRVHGATVHAHLVVVLDRLDGVAHADGIRRHHQLGFEVVARAVFGGALVDERKVRVVEASIADQLSRLAVLKAMLDRTAGRGDFDEGGQGYDGH